jgi:ATP-dependent RNA helicase RhlE
LSFNEFNLSQDLIMGLSDMGFSKPTPIQTQAIPIVLDGKDLLASAQTGTGKTAAFALPLLEKLSTNRKSGIRALILAPTRELAMQIDEQFWTIGYHTGVTTASVYGGTDWGAQEQAIRDGVNVLVATPGRLLDHIKVSNVDFSQIEFLVLDEADRMLDMGFIPDVLTIIRRLPKQRQTLLFSATLSDKIETLARELTKNPVRINISSFVPAEGVVQLAYKVQEEYKLDLVLHLFDDTEVSSAIVFTSTKRGADNLARALRKKGVKVSAIHGDRDQKEREATLGDFKAGRINVIVATDVMARGIDVTGVSHVVNFDVPRDVDDYIHRIGRTARAEKKGTAITLVSRNDTRYFQVIHDKMGDRLKVIENPVIEGVARPKPSHPPRPIRPVVKPAPIDRPVRVDHHVEEATGDEAGGANRRSRPRPKRRPDNRVKTVRPDESISPVSPNVEKGTTREPRVSVRPSDESRPAPRNTNRRPVPSTKPPSRHTPNSNGRSGKADLSGKDDRNNHERRQQQLIDQVSNPFQQGKVEQKKEETAEKGIWGKLKSVFGSKK